MDSLSSLDLLRKRLRQEISRQVALDPVDWITVDRLKARLHDTQAAIAAEEAVSRHLGAGS